MTTLLWLPTRRSAHVIASHNLVRQKVQVYYNNEVLHTEKKQESKKSQYTSIDKPPASEVPVRDKTRTQHNPAPIHTEKEEK
jgi:hypothetical protein